MVVVGVSSETSLLQSHFGGDKRKLLKIFFVKLRLANILKLLDRKVFVLGISTDSTFGSIFPSPVTSKRLKTVPMNLVGKNQYANSLPSAMMLYMDEPGCDYYQYKINFKSRTSHESSKIDQKKIISCNGHLLGVEMRARRRQ